MKMVTTRTLMMLLAVSLVAACGARPLQETVQEPLKEPENLTQCRDPRPQMCTREYKPVCASRDTGVRCVTTPCPSTEWRTYGNACDACSDSKVSGYREGACKQ
ncbi:hypothetical protein GCM10027343_02080 [Noviherbaspirillum agri]